MKHNITTVLVLVLLVLSSVIFWQSGFAEIVIAGIVILYLAIIVYGVFVMKAGYFLPSIVKGKNKGIALTFDDGPDPEVTPRILSLLAEANVKATFFVIGKKAERHPELLRRIIDEGHTIGNHSYSHHYGLGFFSGDKLKEDFARCNEVIQEVTGKRPLLFRPPFGVTNPRYKRALIHNGLKSVGWSVRSFDTRAKDKYEIINRVISGLKNKDIVLLHDHLAVTADALADLLPLIKSKKLSIEPLPKLINQKPYAEI